MLMAAYAPLVHPPHILSFQLLPSMVKFMNVPPEVLPEHWLVFDSPDIPHCTSTIIPGSQSRSSKESGWRMIAWRIVAKSHSMGGWAKASWNRTAYGAVL
jgi:hypothetical protein